MVMKTEITENEVLENCNDHPMGTLEERVKKYRKVCRTSRNGKRLLKRLHITRPTAKLFGLGYGSADRTLGDSWDTSRLVIPVRSRTRELLAVIGYAPNTTDCKYLPLHTGMGTHLFPLHLVPPGTKHIILVEGLKDCIIAYQHGLVAITGTGGAGTWKPEWSQILQRMGIDLVTILYDNDKAGDEGAAKVAGLLHRAGMKVRVARWPKPLPDKFDLWDWFANGKTVKELKEQVLSKAARFVPATDTALAETTMMGDNPVTVNGSTVIVYNAGYGRTDLRDILTEILVPEQCFFRRGDNLWCINQERAHAILDANTLAGALPEHVEWARCIEREEDSHGLEVLRPQYIEPPSSFLEQYLRRESQSDRFPEVIHYSRLPQFDRNYNLTPPGYHRPSQTYYAGPRIKPAEGTHHLDKLLSEFAWENPLADKATTVGIFLTAMLMTHFVGKHPVWCIRGNQQSLGKSLLAELLSRFVDNGLPGSVTYTPDDDELEKRIASHVRRGEGVITIDNLKYTGKTRIMSSPVLERSITSPMLSFRLLGTNSCITMPNTVQFCISLNEGTLSRDLITRCVFTNLFCTGDATRRKYSRQVDRYMTKHRPQIIAELVGMVTRWRNAGCRRYEIPTTRFNRWATIIGSILQHNGIEGFLSNVNASMKDMDADHDEIIKLMTLVCRSGRHNTNISSAELVSLAKEGGLLPVITEKSDRGAATAMSRYLARFEGEVISVQDDLKVTSRCKNDTASNKKSYRFETSGTLPTEWSGSHGMGVWHKAETAGVSSSVMKGDNKKKVEPALSEPDNVDDISMDAAPKPFKRMPYYRVNAVFS